MILKRAFYSLSTIVLGVIPAEKLATIKEEVGREVKHLHNVRFTSVVDSAELSYLYVT